MSRPKPRHPRAWRRPWTPLLDNSLLDQVERGVPFAEIARRMGRTLDAVQRRWLKLGGGKSQRSRLFLTRAETARLLGVGQTRLDRWIARAWLPAAKSGFRRGGFIPDATEWAITQIDLQAFMREERFWPLWDPEPITDPHWRDWARELRGGARYLSIREVARLTCYDPKSIDHMCRRGQLRYVQITPTAPGKKGSAFARYVRVDWLSDVGPTGVAALAALERTAPPVRRVA